MADPLKPSAGLLAKLGSIVVHTEESIETNDVFDRMAVNALLGDPDVREWIGGMNALAMLPLKRSEGGKTHG